MFNPSYLRLAKRDDSRIIVSLGDVDQVVDLVLEDFVVVVELATAQVRFALDDLL